MDMYLEIKVQFEKNRNEENAVKMAAYMRNLFPFYGLPTPKRKTIYKDFLKSERKNKIVDWDFLDKCYENEYREFQYLVLDYLVVMQKFLTYNDVPHILCIVCLFCNFIIQEHIGQFLFLSFRSFIHKPLILPVSL